jgi:hypothetical protein
MNNVLKLEICLYLLKTKKMKQEILKLIDGIKDNLKQIDKDGTYHPLLDDIYESLALMEDEIYEDDARGDSFDIDDDDY